jgi:hypothetical protein
VIAIGAVVMGGTMLASVSSLPANAATRSTGHAATRSTVHAATGVHASTTVPIRGVLDLRDALTGPGIPVPVIQPVTVRVDNGAPVALSTNNVTYGLIPFGRHTVTATLGSATATGTVTVTGGQEVTAVIYRNTAGTMVVGSAPFSVSNIPVGLSQVYVTDASQYTGNLTLEVQTTPNGPYTPLVQGLTPANSGQPLTSKSVTVPQEDFSLQVINPVSGAVMWNEPGHVLLAGYVVQIYIVGAPATHIKPNTFDVLVDARNDGVGYRMYASDGGVFQFGDAGFYGSLGSIKLNKPIVGATSQNLGLGYWMVASDGGVFEFGDAPFYGSLGNIRLNAPIVGMAETPDGGGYWLVGSDGGVFEFGDAAFYGSLGNIHLNKPIVGIEPTPDGLGYWLVASDGGVFEFGDAHFYGSTGNVTLNQPVVGMTSTLDGRGYWLVASDGGIFEFGDAAFYGSTGNVKLNKPVVGMEVSPDSLGYYLVASDGGVFEFGDAKFYGSLGNIPLNQPIVAMTLPGSPRTQ